MSKRQSITRPSLCEGARKARLYSSNGDAPAWEQVRVSLDEKDVSQLASGQMIFLVFAENPVDPVNSRVLRLTIGKDVQVHPSYDKGPIIDLFPDPSSHVRDELYKLERRINSLFKSALKDAMINIRSNYQKYEYDSLNITRNKS